MNLPWYGWSRWTCFVRSRSGRSRSDHERSSSRSAYSCSCVAATGSGLRRARLERLLDPLQAPFANGDDVERDQQRGRVRMRRQPRLGRAADPPLLLRADHLQRIAAAAARLAFDLDESQASAAADDQVELVPADPDVRPEDPPAAQPVPARRSLLCSVTRSRAPGTTGGESGTARARARPRSARA